jgi:hypothetical protein
LIRVIKFSRDVDIELEALLLSFYNYPYQLTEYENSEVRYKIENNAYPV